MASRPKSNTGVLDGLLQAETPRRDTAVRVSAYAGTSGHVRRETARANWLAMSGDQAGAVLPLAHCAARFPFESGPRTSLGFLLSQDGARNAAKVWDVLRGPWRDLRDSGELTTRNFGFFSLGIEAAMAAGSEDGERAIRDVYLPFIRRTEIKTKRSDAPILLWHLPKTGGTSLAAVLSAHFYNSGMAALPSYTTRRFLRWLVEHQDGLFPFLSSAHLCAAQLGLTSPRGYHEIVILRDPASRAISAWRQYRVRPRNRLWTLPQHGAMWRFFPVCGLGEWARRVPQDVVAPLCGTFAGRSQRIDDVDTVLKLSELDDSVNHLMERFGVTIDGDSIRERRNATDKTIAYEPEERALLETAVQIDRDFLNHLPEHRRP
ncbi:MAG: sulfotransferase family protein [Rhodobacteraceae bacterium]|nr:sulfotransferase family protein [Paracoccaceae bacterium]